MNKKIKIYLLVLAALFLLLIIYLNYETYFSESARVGKANIENIKKIKEGMSVDQVILIMGKPDSISNPDKIRYPYFQYYYSTNDESFANITVVVDSNMLVKATYYPKYK